MFDSTLRSHLHLHLLHLRVIIRLVELGLGFVVSFIIVSLNKGSPYHRRVKVDRSMWLELFEQLWLELFGAVRNGTLH